jgi:hypothetical protein
MKRLFILTVAIFILIVNQISAQQKLEVLRKKTEPQVTTQYLHQYYIYISGITSRQDVITLESTLQKKQGVSYFLGNRYPVRYFLLKSENDISKATFISWIDPKLTVEYFEEGENSKEGAMLLYNKYNLSKK